MNGVHHGLLNLASYNSKDERENVKRLGGGGGKRIHVDRYELGCHVDGYKLGCHVDRYELG